ncbi:RluA family pseudouridine synthase [Leptospira sp. 201903070]|uniref:RluA family pseudouridine synthase n=1 Tax=Leptospira ainlahdjerensis TaxID=2810033 RepID=A0ABS2U976_9LEPT|nr:RluA family pseudouridine synthase [Leptospira ainlahdjerensis]MBM9576922.1 RluA family pseudouridine synthase [Leptospira ainlahdjerensis]
MEEAAAESLQITIRAEDSSMRLDQFLSKKFTYHSRTAWQKEISEGRILLSGKKVKPGIILKEGDQVVYQIDNKTEPPVRTDYKIIFEDEWLVAVDKPGDLPVHPAGIYRKGNLLTLLQESGRFRELYTIHRLDRETSGVILFAKNQKTASKLSGLFSSGNIQKFYITKVWNSFPKSLTAYGILKADPDSKIRKKRKFAPLEKKKFDSKRGLLLETEIESEEEISFTYFRKIQSDLIHDKKDSNASSYVLCKPITGRMHQIRATLYGLGYPLFGDKLYGKEEEVFLEFIEGKEPDLVERLGMKRQALHAYAICFIHPDTNRKIKIRSPIPEDFL